MKEGADSKTVLLVRLLNAIDEGRYSFEGLKHRIAEGEAPPSTRTLRRYLSILEAAGFPWYFDRAANVYRFADGYSLKRLELSSGELFGLVALRSLSASLGGAIGASIDEVAEKIAGSAGRSARARIDSPSPVAFRLPQIQLDQKGEREFALLSAAERSSRSVRFEYVDKEGRRSARTVDPYGFIVSAGRVYCVAYDHARANIRTFAVDSVSQADVLGATFERPEGFDLDAYAAESISGVMHGAQPSEVRVWFAPRVAKAAAAARIIADQHVTTHPDGSVEIAYHVADLEELVRWVLGWGAQAEILSPPQARERIAAVAREITRKYGED